MCISALFDLPWIVGALPQHTRPSCGAQLRQPFPCQEGRVLVGELTQMEEKQGLI